MQIKNVTLQHTTQVMFSYIRQCLDYRSQRKPLNSRVKYPRLSKAGRLSLLSPRLTQLLQNVPNGVPAILLLFDSSFKLDFEVQFP